MKRPPLPSCTMAPQQLGDQSMDQICPSLLASVTWRRLPRVMMKTPAFPSDTMLQSGLQSEDHTFPSLLSFVTWRRLPRVMMKRPPLPSCTMQLGDQSLDQTCPSLL